MSNVFTQEMLTNNFVLPMLKMLLPFIIIAIIIILIKTALGGNKNKSKKLPPFNPELPTSKSIANQPQNSIKLKGKQGEDAIYWILANFIDVQNIFKNVYLKREDGKLTEIDIICVCTKGVFVFESKNYSGLICGKEDELYWTKCLRQKKMQFYNPIKQNENHIKCLKYNLKNFSEKNFYSIIAFSDGCNIDNVKNESDARIVHYSRIKSIFDNINSTCLSNEDIEQISEMLSKTQDATKKIKEQHLNDLQDTFSKCPLCRSELVERRNKKTDETFYGCKSYPKCRYTAKELKQVTK